MPEKGTVASPQQAYRNNWQRYLACQLPDQPVLKVK
jgi:hypothetical protein